MPYITEKYIGKSKTLQEAEAVLGQLVVEIRKNPLEDYTNHPLSEQFSKLIAKQFNFKKVYIKWERTAEAAPNMMTLFSSSVFLKASEGIKASKDKGYYGDGSHCAYIIASSTMIVQLNLTVEETMAVFMHELGHNFDTSIYMIFNILTSWLKVFKNFIIRDPEGSFQFAVTAPAVANVIAGVGTTTNPGKGILFAINSFFDMIKDKIPWVKKIWAEYLRFVSFMARGSESIFSGLLLLAVPTEILISPFYHFLTIPVRKCEVFADSFAATYGYGPALASGLNKMSDYNLLRTKPNENEIRSFARDLVLVNREIMLTCLGADHGTSLTRTKSNIQHLQKEITYSGYPSEMKKEILDQIKELESIYDTYMNASNDKKFAMTAWTRKTIDSIFDGRGDYIAKLFPDIKTVWENVCTIDDCKLAIYESCLRNEMTKEDRDYLLEFYQ